MKTPRLGLCLASFSLLCGLCACSPPEAADKEQLAQVKGMVVHFEANNPQLALFKTAEVQRRDHDELSAAGRLMLDERHTARIYSPFTGRLEKLLVDWGTQVEAGQALAKLSSPDIGMMKSELARDSADLNQTQRNLERAQSLLEAGVISQKDFDLAQSDYLKAKADYERSKSKAAAYATDAKQGQNGLLISPIAGRVVQINATVGTEVRSDNNQPGNPPLFVISATRQLVAILDAPETELARLKPGQPMEIGSSSIPDLKVKAQINLIQDAIDPQSRTLKLRAYVANPNNDMKSEQFITAKIQVPALSGVVVPASAVLLSGQDNIAYVKTGATDFERRLVTAQEAGFQKTRITQGVAEKETLVVEGALFLEQIYAGAKKP